MGQDDLMGEDLMGRDDRMAAGGVRGKKTIKDVVRELEDAEEEEDEEEVDYVERGVEA